MTSAPIIGIREPGAIDLVHALLQQGVSVRIRVSGDSMKTLLKGGETVELSALAKRQPELGDILFLRSRQGSPVVHRLIWRRNCGGTPHLLTKGDACAGFDGFVPAECALGRVERIILPDSGLTEKAIDLQTPLMRLQARLIVSRTLSRYALRRLKSMLRGQMKDREGMLQH